MEQPDTKIVIPHEWEVLIQGIKRFDGIAKVFILGGMDTGKTALALYLANTLSRFSKTALIDTDPGQSVVGPPSTAGLLVFNEQTRRQNFQEDLVLTAMPLKPNLMTFVGSTTPAGNLVQAIVGAKKLLEAAIRLRPGYIVINSSGMVFGDMAMEFKFQKMDLISPTHIIALERERELTPILKNFYGRRFVSIVRLKIAEAVTEKTQAQRFAYRSRAFASYFMNPDRLILPLRTLGLHGRIPDFRAKEAWTNLLIGLCDSRTFTRSLGVIHNTA
ncbi:MAG TPA: Clp1/GlmU family protein [Thermodesulfovibrionia bacterium]|nr:Clp1/GlmU family protein [Thermodesulfovibrionia bacterium]